MVYRRKERKLDTLSPTVFVTPRLKIRELCEGDFEAFFAMVSSGVNTAYLPFGPIDGERAEAFIARAMADRLTDERRAYRLGIELKEEGRLIGVVTLVMDPELPVGQAGYIVSAEHWRRGYATEALMGLVRFAFLGPELHRVFAECDEKNAASVRVLEKAGFRREGHFIKARRTERNGRRGWASVFHYAMLRKEFLMTLPDGSYSASGDID